jgi:hypothetical protein
MRSYHLQRDILTQQEKSLLLQSKGGIRSALLLCREIEVTWYVSRAGMAITSFAQSILVAIQPHVTAGTLSEVSSVSGYPIPPPRREARATRKSRDMQALHMKAQGHTLQEIADSMGMSGDPRKAARSIRRAAATAYRWASDEARMLEMESLDQLEHMLWTRLRGDQPFLSNARGVVTDPNSGEPLEDARYALETHDRIMRIKERRAKLMGLDAPTKSEVITIDKVDAEIKKLESEIAAMSPKTKVMDDDGV